MPDHLITPVRLGDGGTVRLHSREAGCGGPPVVLVHGLGMSSRMLLPTLRRLAPHHRVLAPDLPGYGRTRGRRGLGVGGLADALERWLDARALGPAVVLGHSMGAQVVAEVARRRPDLVAALVLVGPTRDPSAPTRVGQVWRLLRDAPRERPGLVPVAVLDYLLAGPLTMLQVLRRAMRQPEERTVAGVAVPTLVLRGEHDPVAGLSWCQELVRLLPDGRLLVVPGAPHGLPYSRPDDVAAAVRWWAGPARAAAPGPEWQGARVPSLLTLAHRFETGLRDLASSLARRRGWTPTVLAHPGYGSGGRVRVLGRVLLAPASAHPEGRLAIPGWQRFLTLEAPHTEVSADVAGVSRRLVSDSDGLLDAVLDVPDTGDRAQVTVTLRVGSRTARAPAHLASAAAHRGVVCDIDDTVLVTGIGHPLLAAWRTFLQRSARRRPVPGMADLLHELTRSGHVPVLYLSNGPWNLVGVLERFLARHGFPPGALLLTDWGLRQDRWFRDGRAHKRGSLLRLADDLPGVDWLLVGDTGEHDPALYAEFATRHPDRVTAILLRDVDADEPVVDTSGVVPVVRAADGAGLSAGLARLGV